MEREVTLIRSQQPATSTDPEPYRSDASIQGWSTKPTTGKQRNLLKTRMKDARVCVCLHIWQREGRGKPFGTGVLHLNFSTLCM
jgi:hypothetical protein